MGKFFSIIVPVYKVEEYLDDCIISILHQSFTDYELILVDDGSPDNCPQICDKYALKDERITVIHQKNGGLSCARNSGLRVACGKYLMFIDSDDGLLYDDALSDIKKEIDSKNNPDVLLTKYQGNEFKDGIDGETLIKQMVARALDGKSFNVTVWDKIYKSDFINKKDLSFKEGLVHEDHIWTCIVLDNAKRCEFTSTQFYRHNIVEASITRSKSEKSTLNRAVSKLRVAKTNIDYFKAKDCQCDNYSVIYEFYTGMYISGIIESGELKEKPSKKYFNRVLRETADVINMGLKTKRTDYKLLAVLKLIFGIKAVKLIRLLKR